MKTHIYLKGGAVIDLDFSQFSTRGTGDGLSNVTWKHLEEVKLRLHHLNLTQVAAITVEDDE